MDPIASSSIAASDSSQPHCQHRGPAGRRCRMVVSELKSDLCSRHSAQRQKDLDQAEVASKLIGDTEEFRSALAINRSLGELYKLQARNQIHTRRAAVLAYTANLLLRTLPAVEKELHPDDEEITIDLGNLPRPPYSKFHKPQAPPPNNPPIHPTNPRTTP